MSVTAEHGEDAPCTSARSGGRRPQLANVKERRSLKVPRMVRYGILEEETAVATGHSNKHIQACHDARATWKEWGRDRGNTEWDVLRAREGLKARELKFLRKH